MTEPEPESTLKKEFSLTKNWKKYFFEFLMLFFAVFLGFVAENIREDFAEKQQAKELAKSFYEELKNDSITVVARVQGRIKKERAIEYMVAFFKDSSLTLSSKALSINFMWAITVRTPITFTPRTVVMEQLKNSGSLRYFKSNELQRLIGDLSVSIDYINERQALEAFVYTKYMEPIVTNHMDFDFQYKLFINSFFDRLLAYENSSEIIPFHLSQIEKIDRLAIINELSYYHTNALKSTRLNSIQKYVEVNAALLKELREEYNISDINLPN